MKTSTDNTISIVLCAGFGTRLLPITRYIPKVVLPINNAPIAWHSISKIFDFGIKEVHCNTHHLAETVENVLKKFHSKSNHFSKRLYFWKESQILETGGGIFNILSHLYKTHGESLWNKNVFIVSGDIYAYCPILELFHYWNTLDSPYALMASLQARNKRPDNIVVDRFKKHILGFGSIDKEIIKNCFEDQLRLFSNHQIIKAQVLQDAVVQRASSVKLIYQPLLDQGKPIHHFCWHDHWPWHNVGTLKEYAQADDQSTHLSNQQFFFNHNLITFFGADGYTSLNVDQALQVYKRSNVIKLIGDLSDYPTLKEKISELDLNSFGAWKRNPLLQEAGPLFILDCDRKLIPLPSHSLKADILILDASLFKEGPYNSEPLSEQGLSLCLVLHN